MAKHTPSIVWFEDKCAACKHCNPYECGGHIDLHHVYGGTANRRLSDKDGLVVPLCVNHHTGKYGVHNGNRKLDILLKQEAELAYMREYNATEEDFIHRYGKSYLWIEETDTDDSSALQS